MQNAPPPLYAVNVRVPHACGPPTNSTTTPTTGTPTCSTATDTAGVAAGGALCPWHACSMRARVHRWHMRAHTRSGSCSRTGGGAKGAHVGSAPGASPSAAREAGTHQRMMGTSGQSWWCHQWGRPGAAQWVEGLCGAHAHRVLRSCQTSCVPHSREHAARLRTATKPHAAHRAATAAHCCRRHCCRLLPCLAPSRTHHPARITGWGSASEQQPRAINDGCSVLGAMWRREAASRAQQVFAAPGQQALALQGKE